MTEQMKDGSASGAKRDNFRIEKGTFSFAYRLNEAAVGKTIYGLLSLSNSNADKEYGALYIIACMTIDRI